MPNNLNIPIYLDTNLLLDLLASLEGGFSTAQKITTDTTDSKQESSSKNGNIGIGSGILLRLNLEGSKEKSENKTEKQIAETEKYYTYGSMMNKLLDELHEKNLIKTLNNEKDWENLNLYDFVEIQGIFLPNPISNALKKISNLIDLIINFSTLNLDDKTNKNQNKKQKNQNKELKEVDEIITRIIKEVEKENSQKYIIKTENKYDCFVNLFNQFIRDNSGIELPHGNFKIIGKVIKKTEKNDGINLLEDTSFTLTDELLNSIIESLEILNKTTNIPKVKTTINGPCIQIIPIAVFA